MKKWSKSVKVGVCLAVLAIGLGGCFVQQGGFFQKRVIEEETAVYIQLRSGDPEEVKRGQKRVVEYDRAMEDVFDRHPELRPKWKKVDPGNNGYLKLIQLAESYEIGSRSHESILDVPDEVRDVLYGAKKWDNDVAREYWLKEIEKINEIRSIGLMTEQSMVGSNIDYLSSNFHSEFVIRCTRLLCLDARFSAQEGNDKRAIGSLLAANGIVKHISQIEAPCLVSDVVAMISQSEIFAAAINDVMLTKSEISDLRKKLKPRTNKDLGRALLGEFYVTTRAGIMPLVQSVEGRSTAYDVPDLKGVYDDHAERCKHDVKFLSRVSTRGRFTMEKSHWPSYKSKEKLSKQAMEFTLDYRLDLPIYSRSYARNQILYRYYDAVLAIMAGEEPPVELLTGKPFVFDPVTREVEFPIDPLFVYPVTKILKVPHERVNQ